MATDDQSTLDSANAPEETPRDDAAARPDDAAPAPVEPVAAETGGEIVIPERPPAPRQWYVLKVQSNREDSIKDAISKRLKINGLDHYVSDVVVPTEKVTEIKDGKKRVIERKFYPGYIMIHMELNDDAWFVIRETAGVGDFVGADGKPVPMSDQDVAKMLGRKEEGAKAEPRLKISFHKGDRVKIREGTFENFEGDVDEVIEAKGLVRVMIQIFGRPTPVELEYWQVEPV
jgi:transcriptional antiterminator NusG